MEGANMASKLIPELKNLPYSPVSTFKEVDRAPIDAGPARPIAPLTPEARKLADIFADVDIRLNGNRPWDIQVFDSQLYRRVLSQGSLGAGESYMDGWWDADALDEFFTRVHRLNPYDKLGAWGVLWLALKGRILNRQTKRRSREVAHEHYDLGNDLYEAMLGRRMQYTCAYWKDASTLDEAQEKKLSLICRKLQLAPGMRVLELGGGFGGFAQYMASEYGCQVVSYNISKEQVAYGRELCHGLPVRFEQKDYRESIRETDSFDRVAAVGLCEHIGYKNYRGFLEVARSRLKDKGLFLLHTIGGNESVTSTDAWVDKYIFPNGMIPSLAQLGKAMEGLWVVEDLHNFGPDYDRTLLAWWRNFERAWPMLRQKYDDRFYRMWKFYIMGSAGRFRARKLQLWQFVLSKGDIPAYTPVR
jgi:cyclopropane-fatty-acyl-phospholipid synthase